MDRFQMNRSGCRPYQYTCGMNSGMAGRTDQSFSDMAKQVPAMAYVPYQEFAPTFELKKALQVGTIFPELCKPFCGRRGGADDVRKLYFQKELLQFIDQVSFAIDDLLLFLDTHPKEKRALEYYSELSARRNELLEKYAKFYGPLTIDTGNDSNLKSWQWMEQPFPWEQEGGCR